MKLTLTQTLSAAALLASALTTQAATLAEGPDAWARGTVANDGSFASVSYGWDVFDAGSPGPFGNSTLDDSSPEVGIDPTGADAKQGDPSATAPTSASG